MTRLVGLCLLMVLSACTPRAALIFAPELTADLPTRSVFIATTRVFEKGEFGDLRTPYPTFLRYDISVPPKRPQGSVETPNGEIDPNIHFLAKGRAIYSHINQFRSDLRAALNQRGAHHEAVIYVHGFNNTFDEGVLRITQLAEDFQIPGVALHYSWPSAANVLNYAYDRDSVLFARDGLNSLIAEVQAAGARSIVLVAHSVGSHLTMEVLRDRAIASPGSVARDFTGIVLISPDIDIQLFRRQAKRVGPFPEAFGIFVSRKDRALQLSARLTGQRNRLGTSSAEAVADLDVTLFDVTEFSKGAGHFTAGDSPLLIKIFGGAGNLAKAFSADSAGNIGGLLPGTILTVQNATEIFLSPFTILSQ